MSEDKAGNVMWFVAGIALGATITLLYSPASGRVIRRKIGRNADRGRTAISETSRDLYDRGKELFEKGRQIADEAAELFDRGRKIIEG